MTGEEGTLVGTYKTVQKMLAYNNTELLLMKIKIKKSILISKLPEVSELLVTRIVRQMRSKIHKVYFPGPVVRGLSPGTYYREPGTVDDFIIGGWGTST